MHLKEGKDMLASYYVNEANNSSTPMQQMPIVPQKLEDRAKTSGNNFGRSKPEEPNTHGPTKILIPKTEPSDDAGNHFGGSKPVEPNAHAATKALIPKTEPSDDAGNHFGRSKAVEPNTHAATKALIPKAEPSDDAGTSSGSCSLRQQTP